MDKIIKYDNNSTKIINNKTIFFISNYWKTFTQIFGMKFKFLIFFHPQTDNQAKKNELNIETNVLPLYQL